ncbi:hypothetical protein [Bradyrhizobium lablabi]|uniref:hypothetical protein n=1 Tax=Bradyrhizobium lablabi TaxID=722472 RepID=UPI0012AB7EBD|nr:hypothetical protein [Bradyrhizobium lablabi]
MRFFSKADRQPKCELLDGARDEAIGVPLLPLRQPGHGKVKHSDGYLVQVANRQCVEYVEPHRKAMIEVDFGNSVARVPVRRPFFAEGELCVRFNHALQPENIGLIDRREVLHV